MQGTDGEPIPISQLPGIGKYATTLYTDPNVPDAEPIQVYPYWDTVHNIYRIDRKKPRNSPKLLQ